MTTANTQQSPPPPPMQYNGDDALACFGKRVEAAIVKCVTHATATASSPPRPANNQVRYAQCRRLGVTLSDIFDTNFMCAVSRENTSPPPAPRDGGARYLLVYTNDARIEYVMTRCPSYARLAADCGIEVRFVAINIEAQQQEQQGDAATTQLCE